MQEARASKVLLVEQRDNLSYQYFTLQSNYYKVQSEPSKAQRDVDNWLSCISDLDRLIKPQVA